MSTPLCFFTALIAISYACIVTIKMTNKKLWIWFYQMQIEKSLYNSHSTHKLIPILNVFKIQNGYYSASCVFRALPLPWPNFKLFSWQTLTEYKVPKLFSFVQLVHYYLQLWKRQNRNHLKVFSRYRAKNVRETLYFI